MHEMESGDEPRQDSGMRRAGGVLRYAWPVPLAILMVLLEAAVGRLYGQRVFFMLHVPMELVALLSLCVAVSYSVRLWRCRDLAPRWVFYLNLCGGPVPLGLCLISVWVLAWRLYF